MSTELTDFVSASPQPVDPEIPDANGADSQRDLRIDFMRGFACVSFITAHFEAFTWLHMVFWERLGLFSGAELFVLWSGFLTGMVNRRVFDRPDGAERSAGRLWRRGAKLYVAYVALTLLVILVTRLTPLDMTVITTFTDHRANVTFALIPPPATPFGQVLHNVFLLRTTPHQVQILGLYAVLLVLTPFVLVLLRRGHPVITVALSVALWGLNTLHPMQLTGALFENAFPLLAWQVYFVLALLAGWYRHEIVLWLDQHKRAERVIWALAAAVAIASLVFAQATDNAGFPPWFRLDVVSPQQFRMIYDAWFLKNPVGVGRLVSAVAFTVTFYRLLGACWPTANRFLGPLFEPLGRSSLYVFLVHVPLLAVVNQIPGYFDGPVEYSPGTIWLNTAILCAMIATIWGMVRVRFLFGVVPR